MVLAGRFEALNQIFLKITEQNVFQCFNDPDFKSEI